MLHDVDIDMVDDRIGDLTRRAAEGPPTEAVALLADAVGLAWEPLRRIELLMLLTDAAGRAAHQVADAALQGQGMPEGTPATWAQIGTAARLSRATAFRQFHGGRALSWSPAARGVRHADRHGEGNHS